MKRTYFEKFSSLPNLLLALRLTVVRESAEFQGGAEGYLMKIDEYEKSLRNGTIESGFPIVDGDMVIFNSVFYWFMPAILPIIRRVLEGNDYDDLQEQNFVFWEGLFLTLTEDCSKFSSSEVIKELVDEFLEEGGYFICLPIAWNPPACVMSQRNKTREIDKKILSLFECEGLYFLSSAYAHGLT